MSNNYHYYFGTQAGLFITSLGFLAQGIIYLDEFFIVMPILMLLVTSPIYFHIRKLRKEKAELFRIFTRLCIVSILLGGIFNSVVISSSVCLSCLWINKLRNDDST